MFIWNIIMVLLNGTIARNLSMSHCIKHVYGTTCCSILQKKVITLSTGGYRGFYQLGVCKFIKENYDLTDYVFSGASSGAWNSLFLTYKGGYDDFYQKIFDHDIDGAVDIKDLALRIKHKISTNFKTEDFELDKLYVGVTIVKHFRPQVIIYTNFSDLNDALDSCSASSHIPYLTTKGFIKTYRKILTFDGGFSKNPYLPNSRLYITPDMWNKNTKEPVRFFRLSDYTTLFSGKTFSFHNLLERGYSDSKRNKEYLDSIFIHHDS